MHQNVHRALVPGITSFLYFLYLIFSKKFLSRTGGVFCCCLFYQSGYTIKVTWKKRVSECGFSITIALPSMEGTPVPCSLGPLGRGHPLVSPERGHGSQSLVLSPVTAWALPVSSLHWCGHCPAVTLPWVAGG